jgi:RNA polymerase sigma-70 factor (ECF subfamily)
MRRYNQRLFHVARSLVGSDSEAEDVVQHAYVCAYAHLQQFTGAAAFSTWLTRIVINEALARVKNHTRTQNLVSDQQNPDWSSGTAAFPSPEDDLARRQLAKLLEPPASRSRVASQRARRKHRRRGARSVVLRR